MNLIKSFATEIILVNTQLPENLGATARCMLNFEFDKLRLVKPCFSINHEKIVPVSTGANKVLKKIKVFKNFSDSIKDFNYVIGTTNRNRSLKKEQISIKKLKNLITRKKNKVAIVFGPEQSGLDNEHLSLCDYTIKINTNKNFSSLNLSHAVAIICYDLTVQKSQNVGTEKRLRSVNLAKKNELISFYSALEKSLDKSNFFNVKERKKITFQKIKNIFSKLELSSDEIKILISIFKKFN